MDCWFSHPDGRIVDEKDLECHNCGDKKVSLKVGFYSGEKWICNACGHDMSWVYGDEREDEEEYLECHNCGEKKVSLKGEVWICDACGFNMSDLWDLQEETLQRRREARKMTGSKDESSSVVIDRRR